MREQACAGHDGDCDHDAPPDLSALLRARWSDLLAALGWVRGYGLDPQDFAQEAAILLAARFASRSFDSEELLYAYWRAIAANLAVRSVGERGPGHVRAEVPTATGGDEHPGSGDLEAAVIRRVDFVRAFASLKPAYRRVLLLAGDGYDSAAIADLLGLPSAEAARKQLERARKAARDAYGPAGSCAVLPAAWRIARAASAPGADATAGPAASAGTAALAVAVAVALVAVLGGTPTGAARAGSRGAAAPAQAGAASSPSAWGGAAGKPSPAGVVGAPRPDEATRGAGRASRPPGAGRTAGPPVSACAAGVCVGSRPRGYPAGDTLTVRAADSDAATVTQDSAPICQAVPETTKPGTGPAAASARCTRQEPERSAVKVVSPDSPGGTP